MEPNLQADLKRIQEELDQLKEKLSQQETGSPVRPIPKDAPLKADPNTRALLERLEETCQRTGANGMVSYMGVFSNGQNQSNWVREADADQLLSLGEHSITGQVLTCIGNDDRLRLLLLLLRRPMTVSQLVEQHGYRSTGQVYHHLRPLLAADLVMEDLHTGRGHYMVQPYRVQGILMLLAGIRDLTDAEYAKGNWEPSEEDVASP